MPVNGFSTLTDHSRSHHSYEVQEIITAVPAWIVRRGISLFFIVIVMVIGLSAIIKYPDTIKTTLKVYSPNAPKSVITRVQGRVEKILVEDESEIQKGQPVIYMESTANHSHVLQLLKMLKHGQQLLNVNMDKALTYPYDKASRWQLGELQSNYEVFYQSFLLFKASALDDLYGKKSTFLKRDLQNLNKSNKQLLAEKQLLQKDLGLAKEEYEMHEKLTAEKVEAEMELKRQESKFLSKQLPLQQNESALINLSSNIVAKEKELMELNQQVVEDKAKFIQALNSFISQVEEWKNKYILSSSQKGKITFLTNIQKNQILQLNQEVFYINPGSGNFYGEMSIPQYNMGKVKNGQEVLIKLKSYPYEEYGIFTGKISSLNDVPYKDSIYFSRVKFNKINSSIDNKPVTLKNGMMADAEIITQDATLLGRLFRNLRKMVDNH